MEPNLAELSPMMRQYYSLKEKYPNTILFFRLGDFYEMFFEDARIASSELDLALTGRDCGGEEKAPMCGVPFHSAESYVAKLVEKGYKVAVCEQVEDPRAVKGLVRRDVVRVITPGTVLEGSMLDEGKNNFICSLVLGDKACGICFADVSTGEVHAEELKGKNSFELCSQVTDRLSRYSPSELLLNPQAASASPIMNFVTDRLGSSVETLSEEMYADFSLSQKIVEGQYGGKSLSSLGLDDRPFTVISLGALFEYLKHTQMAGMERLSEPILGEERTMMGIDLNTRRNLELIETIRSKERRGSLLWVLDNTRTPMGKRLIKTWLTEPLLSPAQITLRQNAVQEFFDSPSLMDEMRDALSGINDLERIMTRVVYGSANGRDLRAIWASVNKLSAIKETLSKCRSTLLKNLNMEIDPLKDLLELIDSAIVEDPPFSVRDGGIIKDGFSGTLDEVREDMSGGTKRLAQIEARERERTGIPKLRTGYNRVFGYYLEVSNSYKDQVPDDYIRKQTLANGERYVTKELKDLENRILSAHDRSISIETRLFDEVRKRVAGELSRVQASARAVAALDVLLSFAVVSQKNDYTRPVINLSGRIYLKDSRHPVVETLLKGVPFVPNDADMDMNDNRVAIITGPNMAGKSTYMRQIAVICVMAQAGCFVPASEAELGVVDHIFTRVGASDDLASGQSTFMIEMSEVADILKNCTSKSLLIFDEIGRGTSTFDGMSIARAVLEYVQDKKTCGAKALFATHYHELTALENILPGVKNFSTAVKKRGDDITFLRRIVRGGADDSFGVEVAKLAGIPEKVIRRAREILDELESGENAGNISHAEDREEPLQIVVDSPQGEVIQRLKNLDVNNLTPLECMNTLFELKNILK